MQGEAFSYSTDKQKSLKHGLEKEILTVISGKKLMK